MPDARISELPTALAPTDTDLAPLVQTSGGTLVTRRATVAQLRGTVLADRPAHVRDYGAVGDGTTNDAPAIQSAINDLATRGGGVLEFAPRVYRLGSAITISAATIRLQGQGFTEGPGPGGGTWFSIASTAFTPITFTGSAARGSGLRDIAFVQTHAAVQDATWAPTDYPYVVRIEDCFGGIDIDNVFLCNITRGIYCRNSGRFDVRRIRGQVFRAGIELDECLDVPRIHSVHFWPFWSADDDVLRWQQANGDALILRRADGAFIDQAFVLGYRSMVRFAVGTTGVTTKFNIAQAYADFVRYGVWVEGNGVTGQIGSMTSQNEAWPPGAPVPGSHGIYLAGTGARVQVGNLRIDQVQDNAIRIEGQNNRLDLFALRCVQFNTRANGAAAIHLADSGANPANACYLGSPALLENGGGGPLTNAGSNATLAMQAPAGRLARPGLAVGSDGTGLFVPVANTLAAAVNGTEVFRATSAGQLTLGAAPGGHALEVAAPVSVVNRLVASGSGTGGPLGLAAAGGDANIGVAITPKGNGALTAHLPDSTTLGGNPRGAAAVDFQMTRGAATQVASGANAGVLAGVNNTAGGGASAVVAGTGNTAGTGSNNLVGGGSGNSATGNNAVVGAGANNTAGGTNAVVGGGQNNTADGTTAWIPGGSRATARGAVGKGAFASGQFVAIGDAQAGEHVLRRATTDATAQRLSADGAAPAAATTIALPNTATFLVRALVVARQVGGAGETAGWDVTALLRRGATAASTTLVGGGGASIAPTMADTGAAAWRLALGADPTLGGVALSGTGEAGKTINWVARVLSVETVG